MIGHIFVAQIRENQVKVPKPDFTADSLAGILQIVFALIGVASLFILLITAIKFQIALGDPTKVAKARNAIIYAAVGLAVSAGAFSLVSLILGGIS